MPYKNYNPKMNEYMKARYHRRRNDAIEHLGGKCASCGSIDSLEFDHIDPERKSFSLGKAFSGWKWERVLAELDKCQLLCHTCHKAKTYGPVTQR